MKILEYSYRDVDRDGWVYEKVNLGKLNLFVGASATGKTKLLNTMFNLGTFASGNKRVPSGNWDLTFELNTRRYRWELITEPIDEKEGRVTSETLTLFEGDLPQKTIIKRDKDSFSFNGKDLPKLTKNECGISVLKEEEAIKEIHLGFSSIMHRQFWGDELKQISTYQIPSKRHLEGVQKERSLRSLFGVMGLSYRLFLLDKYLPEIFKKIVSYFVEIFPFVRATEFVDLQRIAPNDLYINDIQAFCIKEKFQNKMIPLHELSSGMQKVLLVITDLLTLPAGAIYLLDEYENSLGVNAIDFLPSILEENDFDSQIILTSHHPYLINKIPMKNWLVFHRKASHVSILQGEKLQEKFGKSRQQAFIQLINDPFYKEGIE